MLCSTGVEVVYHRRLAYCVAQVSSCGITDVLNTVSCWGVRFKVVSFLLMHQMFLHGGWIECLQVTRNQEATPIKMQHSVQVCDLIVHVPKVNNKLRQMNYKTVVPVKIGGQQNDCSINKVSTFQGR